MTNAAPPGVYFHSYLFQNEKDCNQCCHYGVKWPEIRKGNIWVATFVGKCVVFPHSIGILRIDTSGGGVNFGALFH